MACKGKKGESGHDKKLDDEIEKSDPIQRFTNYFSSSPPGTLTGSLQGWNHCSSTSKKS